MFIPDPDFLHPESRMQGSQKQFTVPDPQYWLQLIGFFNWQGRCKEILTRRGPWRWGRVGCPEPRMGSSQCVMWLQVTRQLPIVSTIVSRTASWAAGLTAVQQQLAWVYGKQHYSCTLAAGMTSICLTSVAEVEQDPWLFSSIRWRWKKQDRFK